MTPPQSDQPACPDNEPHPCEAPSCPVVRFEDINAGKSEVLVLFRDQTYRLRVTKNGKLILNK